MQLNASVLSNSDVLCGNEEKGWGSSGTNTWIFKAEMPVGMSILVFKPYYVYFAILSCI